MSLLFDPDARPVIAHRGNAMHVPEDTPESFRSGLAVGADALEFDVRLAADGTPMVFHDPTLERTTDGHGAIREHSVAALQALDAGARFTPDGGRTFPWRGRGVRIATLAHVLEEFEHVPMIIELKIVEAAQPVLELLRRFGVEHRCIVASFVDAALAPFRVAGLATGAARGDVVRLFAQALLPRGPATLPFQALLIPASYHGLPLPLSRFSAMGHGAGIPTHVWTVDDPRQAQRYWADGVNGIMSNDPAVMVTASREIPPHG